jgi:alpha-glucuronidase
MQLWPWAAVVAVVMLVLDAGASISPDHDDPYNQVPGIGDALWLRYPLISSLARRAEYKQLVGNRVAVVCREGDRGLVSVVKSQLDAAAQELRTGLSGLLGEQIQVSVGNEAADATLVASVLPEQAAALGTEGFRISQADGIVRLDVASSSALLYGVFRLLATMQQHSLLPTNYTSKPAMERRVWQLWDVRYLQS